ncbi:MAG TPA: glycosyltransferase family 4 protein [Methylomusa anaerophila]|uniref:N,N'-diacetylbacillosaminyl-diphospho-undecaprenol alpha-1,3-N-acetylgalactosaminyltransferase n=2 Tax=Methylomusa anaerophila TaxID=1930071 RepID=A0A348AI24_9FIRM|nr:glycosyltransferase family 4 protein [Methylomusa anaerophila]BBB90722.1 N,N'-diacetylbacillosaminyl-diphospho-undecaprenol alpha-1,3-N-acetylgalactosaminyltransferase [Methylomusa anaerophila]HML88675.1 glycosyltransferase family 4 protein [Methylomusa anaerophila]
MKANHKPLILLAVTAPISMMFFKGQITHLQKAGFQVAVLCSPGWAPTEEVEYFPVAMERQIAVFKDFVSLIRIIKLLRTVKPDIVNAGTPKAGLLVGMAAFINHVPVRIYTCHGLRLETLTGLKRAILLATEYIAAFCAHKVVCVSDSLKRNFIKFRLAPSQKVAVIGAGSCNGINMERFVNSNAKTGRREKLQAELGIPPAATIIGFTGRFTKDKGIYELIAAYEQLKDNHAQLYLLLVGDYDADDPVAAELQHRIQQDPAIVVTGFVADAAPYYSLMEVLLLPTYREGLPTVVLEAAAAGKPVVAFAATGCVDAVVDGVTGLLVPVGDWQALANAAAKVLADRQQALLMGQQGQARIAAEFRQELVWENTAIFYQRTWQDKTGQRPTAERTVS